MWVPLGRNIARDWARPPAHDQLRFRIAPPICGSRWQELAGPPLWLVLGPTRNLLGGCLLQLIASLGAYHPES